MTSSDQVIVVEAGFFFSIGQMNDLLFPWLPPSFKPPASLLSGRFHALSLKAIRLPLGLISYSGLIRYVP